MIDDTLSGIAQKYNVDYHKIASDNNISNPDLIYVNDKLKISIEGAQKKQTDNKTGIKNKTYSYKNNSNINISKGNNINSDAYLNRIIQRESNHNPNAYNTKSKAYGIGQLLPSTARIYGGIKHTYHEQLAQMKMYINDKYGSTYNAYDHHIKKGWY